MAWRRKETIVVDTSVIVAAVHGDRDSMRVIKAVIDGKKQAVATPDLMDEIARVMETRGSFGSGITESEYYSFLCSVQVNHDSGRFEGNYVVDQDDDRLVRSALEGGATSIVTNDKRLNRSRRGLLDLFHLNLTGPGERDDGNKGRRR